MAQPAPDFPMFGGSVGQAIQLNIRAVGDPQISVARCQATLSFHDGRNLPVGTSRTVNLGPNEGAFLTLEFSQVVSRLGQRFELRPVVTPINTEGDFPCQTSVELYDLTTGRTTAWAPPPNPGISDPNLDHDDFPPVSGALGQTMRLGVVRTAAGISDPNLRTACQADLIFHNSQGAVVAQKRVALEPGQSDFLDLNLNTQVSRIGERVVYLPCVKPVAAGSTIGCAISVQVFDQFTGWTTTAASAPLR